MDSEYEDRICDYCDGECYLSDTELIAAYERGELTKVKFDKELARRKSMQELRSTSKKSFLV